MNRSPRRFEVPFLLFCVLAATLLAGALAGCRKTGPKTPELLFNPPQNSAKSFEATITSDATATSASQGTTSTSSRPRRLDDSGMALRLTQTSYPAEPDGKRLFRFTADKLRIFAGSQTFESTQTFLHQARIDPWGRSFAVTESGTGGVVNVINRQENIEAIYSYSQPIFSAGRPILNQTWEATRGVPVLRKADLQYRFRYRVLGKESRDGRELWRIQETFSADGTATEREHYTRNTAAGTAEGTGTILVGATDLQTVEATVSWVSDMVFSKHDLATVTASEVYARSRLVFRQVPVARTPAPPPAKESTAGSKLTTG
jgi:hypothetical protein